MYSEEYIKKSVTALALSTLIEVNKVALEDSVNTEDIEYRVFINDVANAILDEIGSEINAEHIIDKPKWARKEIL